MTQIWTTEAPPRAGRPTQPTRVPHMVELSLLWMLGVTLEDDGSASGPGVWEDSYLAECECPEPCPRDHENE
jgi:hypothetical protein